MDTDRQEIAAAQSPAMDLARRVLRLSVKPATARRYTASSLDPIDAVDIFLTAEASVVDACTIRPYTHVAFGDLLHECRYFAQRTHHRRKA